MQNIIRLAVESSNLVKIGLLFFLTIVPFVLGACEPLRQVSVHNQTDETLQIFLDDEVLLAETVPGVVVEYETEIIYPKYQVTAKDTEGNTVYVATWTRDEFQEGRETGPYHVVFPSDTQVPSTESAPSIRVENRSREILQIFLNDSFMGEVGSYVAITWNPDRNLASYTITAKNLERKVVYSETFTRIGRRGIDVTISSPR